MACTTKGQKFCRAGSTLASLIFVVLWLVCAGAAHGYIIVNAPMTDANASGWVLGGNPNSAVLTASNGTDPVGSGWLRITNNSGQQTGFAYNTTTFDLSAGVLIQFDYAAWGGNGADGISVFLFDAGVSPFNIGAFGGSLGYAQKNTAQGGDTTAPGVSGGYVGIGVDEYGNYSNPTEGRYLGPGSRPNALALRGPVNGFGNGAIGGTGDTTSYPWIATSGNNGSLWINSGTRPDQLSANYRKVIIEITPAPNPTVSAWVQFGYNTSPTPMFTNQALPTAISSSQQLMVGFGGSTGGSTNYHEIRNLLITSLNTSTAIDLGITKTPVATGTTTPAITSAIVGNSFQYLITARNYGPNNIPATGVGITDTFPTNITPGSWQCAVVAGSPAGTSCGATSGSGNLNTTANLPRYGAVTYTVNATLNSMPAGNLLGNTASLTIPGSVIDFNPANNSATSTINAYGLPTVSKSFSPTTVPANTNSALTITLTNPNNTAATGVAFTDTFPANLVNASTTATTVCGGTLTPTNGTPAKLTFTGGTIPANGSCTIATNVQSATAATYTNTLAANAVTTANIGSNAAAASAALIVQAAPTVTKSFAASSIASGDTTNMTVTLTNPNATPITLTSAFTDTFPAGMTVNGAAGNTGTCPGVTATAGDNKFTMASGSVIPANSNCTIVVNVTATATGTNTIAAGALKTSAGNNAAAVSAGLTVYNHANLTKAYSASTIATGATSTLTFTITNGTGTPAQSNLGFTDTFPASLTVTGVGAVTGTGCSGTPSFTPSSVTLTNGAITSGRTTCTFTATVQGNTEGAYVNNSAQFSAQSGGLDPSGANATLNVYTPPTVTKSFSPASIGVGGTSILTLTLANPSTNPGNLSTVRVTDTFPTGMTLKNTTFTYTPAGCGAVTKISGGGSAAGDNNVRFTDTSQTPGSSCQVQMNITVSSANIFTNTTNAPTATTATGGVALTGTAASATLDSTQAPTVTKTFAATNIASGGNTNLTVSISNTNASAITLTSNFTDTFPAGMTIGAAGNTGTCTGVTATAGDNKFTMANGTSIPAGGCTIVVNVTSSTAGAAGNTIASGALQTSTGNNAAAATATLNVYAPPTVTKSFAPASISYGGSTILTLTLGNPSANLAAIITAQVDDNFPAGLTLQNTTFSFTPAACGSVTKTSGAASAAGDTSIRFTSATIAPGATCQVAVNVISSATANITNTTNAPIAAGPVALAGTPASAPLTVAPVAPTVTKSFAVPNLASGGNANLTVTIGNTNAGAITLTSAFTDSFPAGMTIGTAGNSGTCTGVTASATAGSFTMANGTSIPAGGCTVIVNVTSSTAGTATNTIAAGALQTVAGSNASAASATLNVYAPPTVTKSFGTSSVYVGGGTALTLSLKNPSGNVAPITTVDADDNFPSGITLQDTVMTFSPTGCGTVTNTSGAASAVGDTNIRFIAGSLAPGTTCQVTVDVTAATAGTLTNTTNLPTAAGPVALTGTAASAGLTVNLLPYPGISKQFSPSQIETSGTSTLKITLSNTNSMDITGAAFTDTFPTSPGQMTTASVLTNTCGGTAKIASPGNNALSLTGGTIPANGSCYLSVSVSAPTQGTYINTTSVVTSTNAVATPSGGTDKLTVASVAAPTVTKSFNQSQVGLNVNSTMTIKIQNTNNGTILTNVSFTDTYQSPLNNTGTPTATNCGGTVTTGSGSLSLSNGTIAANTTCTITVTVASAAPGSYLNNITVNSSAGSASASATLNVLQPLTVSKTFTPSTILPGGTSSMMITISNPNTIAVTTSGAFTDTYPAGMTNSGAVNTPSCGSASNTTNSVTLASGATIPGGGSCSIIITVTAPGNGPYPNTIAAGAIGTSNAGSGPAAPFTGTLNIYAPPTATKTFAVGSLPSGGNTSLTVTIGNTNAVAITLTSVLTDTFPTGMTIGTAGNTGTCGGVTATAGAGSFTMASGTSIPSGGCTVIVNVTSSTAGPATNTIAAGALQTTAGNNAASASATLNVYPLPNITMVKTAQTVSDPVNGSTSPKNIPGAQVLYTILVTNFGAGTADADSIVITDPIPANTALVVSGTPVGFSDGASGLTFTWGGLSSQTDDVQFSKDGTDYSYVPTAGANGTDPAVRYLRINPKGAFKGSTGAGSNPSFTVTFKVIIN